MVNNSKPYNKIYYIILVRLTKIDFVINALTSLTQTRRV